MTTPPIHDHPERSHDAALESGGGGGPPVEEDSPSSTAAERSVVEAKGGESGEPTRDAGVAPVPHRWGVLRHTHYRTIFIASCFSYLGNWFEFVGTQWIVTEKTRQMIWSSYLGAAQLLPTVVLGLLGGIVADSVNRRTLMVVTQAAMMVIALGFALVVWINPSDDVLLRWLLVLALAQGVTIAFNNPAWQVLTPRLVPREELYRAITLNGIAFNAARAVGPALAGVIMALWNPVILFIFNAVTFVIVLAAVTTTPDAPAPPERAGWWKRLDVMWRDTKEAGEFIFLRPGPRAAFLAMVIFATFATPIMRFLSMFVSNVYHKDEKVFGVMTGVMGAGAVIGGLLMKKVPAWYPKHHFIPLSMLLGGIWILLFSLSNDLWVAGTLMIFVGWFWMWAFNSSMAALQLLVPDTMRGRVLSVVNVAALGLMPAGYFLANGVGEFSAGMVKRHWPVWWDDGLSTQLGVGICAAICIGAGIVMLIWRTPEVDGLKPGDAGYQRVPGFWRGVSAAVHRPRPTLVCPKCSYPFAPTGQMPPVDEDGMARCAECGTRTRIGSPGHAA